MKKLFLLSGIFIVSLAVILVSQSSAAARTATFSTPLFIGYQDGDDWEPDIAADGRGNVYVVWAHYGGAPGGCTPPCGSPAAMV